MRSSLRSKIAISMWVLTAVSTLTASVLTGVLLVRSHRESVRSQLEATAASLISLGISDFSELEDFEHLNLFIQDALEMEKAEKIVRIYDSSLKMIFTTVGKDYDILPDELPELGALSAKPFFMTMEGLQSKYESLVAPYLGKGKKRPYYLQVAIPLPKYSQIFKNLWWKDLLLLALLSGIAFVLARGLSKRLLKPVMAIAGHLQEMDPRQIEEWRPLGLDRQGAYLEEIIHGINSLTVRTRQAVLQIRKMSRYVAHEMRTPLTILQGEAETVLARKDASPDDYAAVLKSSLEEIQRMSEIISTILQIGDRERTSSPLKTVFFDLKSWLRENKPRWEKTLGRALELILPPEDLEVRVDPGLLYHLIDNLVRNTRDHAGPQTRCTLQIGGRIPILHPEPPIGVTSLKIAEKLQTENPGGICLQVEDNGSGMSPSLTEALNEGETLLSGTGIGLNLCQNIAAISGLKLHFSNPPKGGFLVEIRFSVST